MEKFLICFKSTVIQLMMRLLRRYALALAAMIAVKVFAYLIIIDAIITDSGIVKAKFLCKSIKRQK